MLTKTEDFRNVISHVKFSYHQKKQKGMGKWGYLVPKA